MHHYSMHGAEAIWTIALEQVERGVPSKSLEHLLPPSLMSIWCSLVECDFHWGIFFKLMNIIMCAVKKVQPSPIAFRNFPWFLTSLVFCSNFNMYDEAGLVKRCRWKLSYTGIDNRDELVDVDGYCARYELESLKKTCLVSGCGGLEVKL